MTTEQSRVACQPDSVRKKAIAERFSKASERYDDHAHIQAAIACDVRKRMAKVKSHALLDIGCATGTQTAELKSIASTITAVDISPQMIAHAKSHYPDIQFIEGQAEALPLPNAAFSHVYSSMALQWVSSPAQALVEIQRVLKKGGVAYLAIMIAGSFQELISAKAVAGLPATVNTLASALAWQNAAISSDLTILDSSIKPYTEKFTDVRRLLRSITGVGAGLSLAKARVKPLNRGRLKALEQAYEQDEFKLYPLTYQVLHLTLEK